MTNQHPQAREILPGALQAARSLAARQGAVLDGGGGRAPRRAVHSHRAAPSVAFRNWLRRRAREYVRADVVPAQTERNLWLCAKRCRCSPCLYQLRIPWVHRTLLNEPSVHVLVTVSADWHRGYLAHPTTSLPMMSTTQRQCWQYQAHGLSQQRFNFCRNPKIELVNNLSVC